MQTNHRAGIDLHPFIARLMHDRPLSSDKTGNANTRPVKMFNLYVIYHGAQDGTVIRPGGILRGRHSY